MQRRSAADDRGCLNRGEEATARRAAMPPAIPVPRFFRQAWSIIAFGDSAVALGRVPMSHKGRALPKGAEGVNGGYVVQVSCIDEWGGPRDAAACIFGDD